MWGLDVRRGDGLIEWLVRNMPGGVGRGGVGRGLSRLLLLSK